MPEYEITEENGVAHLRFMHPKTSNAMGGWFWSGFGEEVNRLNRAGTTRAMVISGEGRNFSAGMDLSVFSEVAGTETAADREAFYYLVRDLQDVMSVVEDARFPVIAAVQGACVGAGLDLAAACDLRIASADAYFRLEEINIGMMADVGVLQRLPRLLPEAIAREMAFAGTTLGADRAQALGFVNTVCADGDATLEAAMNMALRIASKTPLAVSGTKSSMNYARDHSVSDALNWCALMQTSIWQPSDIMKSVEARRRKETPEFLDRKPMPLKPGQHS